MREERIFASSAMRLAHPAAAKKPASGWAPLSSLSQHSPPRHRNHRSISNFHMSPQLLSIYRRARCLVRPWPLAWRGGALDIRSVSRPASQFQLSFRCFSLVPFGRLIPTLTPAPFMRAAARYVPTRYKSRPPLRRRRPVKEQSRHLHLPFRSMVHPSVAIGPISTEYTSPQSSLPRACPPLLACRHLSPFRPAPHLLFHSP